MNLQLHFHVPYERVFDECRFHCMYNSFSTIILCIWPDVLHWLALIVIISIYSRCIIGVGRIDRGGNMIYIYMHYKHYTITSFVVIYSQACSFYVSSVCALLDDEPLIMSNCSHTHSHGVVHEMPATALNINAIPEFMYNYVYAYRFCASDMFMCILWIYCAKIRYQLYWWKQASICAHLWWTFHFGRIAEPKCPDAIGSTTYEFFRVLCGHYMLTTLCGFEWSSATTCTSRTRCGVITNSSGVHARIL